MSPTIVSLFYKHSKYIKSPSTVPSTYYGTSFLAGEGRDSDLPGKIWWENYSLAIHYRHSFPSHSDASDVSSRAGQWGEMGHLVGVHLSHCEVFTLKKVLRPGATVGTRDTGRHYVRLPPPHMQLPEWGHGHLTRYQSPSLPQLSAPTNLNKYTMTPYVRWEAVWDPRNSLGVWSWI